MSGMRRRAQRRAAWHATLWTAGVAAGITAGALLILGAVVIATKHPTFAVVGGGLLLLAFLLSWIWWSAYEDEAP